MAAISGESWLELKPASTPQGIVYINEYFARYPERILGTLVFTENGQYRKDESAVVGTLTQDLLAKAIERLPAGVFLPRDTAKVTTFESIDWTGVKDGGLFESDGHLYRRIGTTSELVSAGTSPRTRIQGLIQVRNAVLDVFRTQLEEASDREIVAARFHLNRVYDRFVAWFGPLSSKENVKAFAGDPDLPLLLSLEQYDGETRQANKCPIFHQRTIERAKPVEFVESASEALLVSLNERGVIDWPRMEALTGLERSDLEQELQGLVFLNPDGMNYETADAYLSGNVRAKLAAAEAAVRIDSRFLNNLEALRQVQPTDLEPAEIEAGLGAPWIPATDIQYFLTELLGAPSDSVLIFHAEAIATWKVTADYRAKNQVSNHTTYGTSRFCASELLEQALNGKTPTAYDEQEDGSRIVNQPETLAAREKQQHLKDSFREWISSCPLRAHRLAKHYNLLYNHLRIRTYDGSHLSFPGMVRLHLRDRDLASHQKNAVWQILQSGTALLAHVVGAGKTWTMAAAAMELKRLGLARKPMIVVPNHLVDAWGAEFLRLYPQARLFVAGREHFSRENRQRAMARIATGDFDAVIVAHRSFEFLPLSDEYYERYVQEQLDELDALQQQAEQDDQDTRIVKAFAKAKKRLEAKLRKRANRENKDQTLFFEQLGIDFLFVDESDLFKNLFFTTNRPRVAGLPNTDSNRAFDMFLKVRFLRQRHKGRGVVFATGTPISNTVAEMFTLLRYLALENLLAQGTDHFDAWAANYGREVTGLEIAPDGSGYRMHTRFCRFVNLPELLILFRSVADVQTANMLQLPRPSLRTGKAIGIAIPASSELKAYIETLIKRAERLRTERVDPKEDNMLCITNDGRKAALDLRLIDPAYTPGPHTKLAKLIEQVFRIWEETRAERLTQLVFVDLSTPDPHRWNAYDEIRGGLMALGIPKGEIAYAHEAKTDAAKKVLYDAVNAGRIRVLIGSTEKMGAGTNVQRLLVALHHADSPWRPRDVEQRDGRILRQGNRNSEVRIYRYVTEGSFDSYMWQTLETKAKFISQVMRGEVTVRNADDLESAALTYAEMKAIASGNPAVIEKIKVDTEIRRLDQLRVIHRKNQQNIQWSLSALQSKIGETVSHIRAMEEDILRRDQHSSGEFQLRVGTKQFLGKDNRAAGAECLTQAILSWANDPTFGERGSYRGFEVWSRGAGILTEFPVIHLRARAAYPAHVNPEHPPGTLLSMDQVLNNIDKHLASEEQHLKELRKREADYREQLARPFDHDRGLASLLVRQQELASALDLDKSDRQAASTEEEEMEGERCANCESEDVREP